jgi:hypothetical protein
MRWVTVLLVGVLGCGAAPPDGPDASVTSSALKLAWSSQPDSIPGTATDKITITSASFSLDNLRIVGDAGPGDPRTSLDQLTLGWSGESAPTTQTFPDAPAGLYSRVVFELGANVNTLLPESSSYEITGTVKIDNAPPVPYRIRDIFDLHVEIDLDSGVPLTGTEDATVQLRADLEKIVSSVDYSLLPVTNGERLLDSFDLQILIVREKVKDAFDSHD